MVPPVTSSLKKKSPEPSNPGLLIVTVGTSVYPQPALDSLADRIVPPTATTSPSAVTPVPGEVNVIVGVVP